MDKDCLCAGPQQGFSVRSRLVSTRYTCFLFAVQNTDLVMNLVYIFQEVSAKKTSWLRFPDRKRKDSKHMPGSLQCKGLTL